MKNLILALLIAAPTAHAQTAQFFRGTKLLSLMEDTSVVSQTMAMGYVVGVADTLNDKMCVPASANVKQLTDVVKQFLIKQPSMRHEPADMIVGAVLMAAFPCKGEL